MSFASLICFVVASQSTGSIAKEPLPIVLATAEPNKAKYEALLSATKPETIVTESKRLKCLQFEKDGTYYVISDDALGISNLNLRISGLKKLEEIAKSGANVLDLSKLSPNELESIRAAVLTKPMGDYLAAPLLRGSGQLSIGSSIRMNASVGAQSAEGMSFSRSKSPEIALPKLSKADKEAYAKYLSESEKREQDLLRVSFQFSKAQLSTEERLERLEYCSKMLKENAAKQQSELKAATEELAKAMFENPDELSLGMNVSDLPPAIQSWMKQDLMRNGMSEAEANQFLQNAKVTSVKQGFAIGGKYTYDDGRIESGKIEIATRRRQY